MPRMTEEEAWALEEFVTNNEITLGPSGSGWLTQRGILNLGLQSTTVQYLFDKAKELQKSPTQFIDELVGEKLAIAV